MYRIVIVLLTIAVLNVGCAGSNGPSMGNPCEERSFDDWLSFYQLKAKAKAGRERDWQVPNARRLLNSAPGNSSRAFYNMR